MRHIGFIGCLILSFGLSAQELDTISYSTAFAELRGMLVGENPASFKRAVFITENAYLSNRLDYQEFDKHIKSLADKCSKIASQSQLVYTESDKNTVEKYAAVFRLMRDTIKFYQDSSRYYSTIPYRYDFDDFWGDKDWRKMHVTKLLTTHTGNCHSLPFLYKILCEEIGAKAYLAMAPNHTYIKQWCKKTGWYNTELTSGYFPIDAWIMASGYIPLAAVQNRIYMDTLSTKQSIAVCVVDLAKGYQKKFGPHANLKFVEKCTELALRYYPLYVNGLILQAETTKKRFENQMAKHSAEYPSDIFTIPEARTIFDNMQKQYLDIHNLGYREMPRDMYLAWLAELKKDREKYENKKITEGLNQTKTK